MSQVWLHAYLAQSKYDIELTWLISDYQNNTFNGFIYSNFGPHLRSILHVLEDDFKFTLLAAVARCTKLLHSPMMIWDV